MGTTSKSVLPDGGSLYVKSGTTEFKVVTSTGQLYHQGQALTVGTSVLNPLGSYATWPSTASAWTAVGTTAAQTLEAKTFGAQTAWTVTTPTSASASALTLSPYGLNIISRTTGLGTQAYTLSLSGSVRGAPLWIVAQACNSSDTITVATTAANLINNTTAGGGLKTITMTCPGSLVKLITASTTLGWVLESIGSTHGGVSVDGTTTLPTLTS